MIEVSFRFSRRDRSEVINSTIRMVSPKTDLFFFQMNRISIPHSSKRYGHLSRLHTPFRSFYSCLKNDPIGPLLLMDILSRPPRVNTPRSDRELFQTLSFTWLGQSFSLPSTEYKKPYSCLTCWHSSEESHYLCHILEFEIRLSCYLSNYRHWSDRARENYCTCPSFALY